MRGRVKTEQSVEMTTSSEDSSMRPPYFSAKRPSEVAVGRAWMRVQMMTTSLGKPVSLSKKKVRTGARRSWMSEMTSNRQE